MLASLQSQPHIVDPARETAVAKSFSDETTIATPDSRQGSVARQLRALVDTSNLLMQIDDVIDRRYRIVRVIGRGGMGIVYEAEHVMASGLRFAIKTLLPPFLGDSLQRVLREAASIASIRHKNVIKVTDVGHTDAGLPFLVMELVGTDLEEYTRARGGTLPASTAAEFCAQVCDALAAAHASKIVHRDIKPSNCLVYRDGDQDYVVVSDFGLARELSGENSASSDWSVAGTKGYVAPEVYSGPGRPDHRVDIYSVGAMLFRLLVGTPPDAAVFSSRQSAVPPALVPRPAPTDLGLPGSFRGDLSRR
jgi:serine/threonine protein kinase